MPDPESEEEKNGFHHQEVLSDRRGPWDRKICSLNIREGQENSRGLRRRLRK